MSDYIDREATRVYCKNCNHNNGKSCEILGAPIVVGGFCNGQDYEWSEEEQAYLLKAMDVGGEDEILV